jgi:curved DNA-binding protein CbpA
MDYLQEAEGCLRKKDYAGYLRNCRRQYDATKLQEDKANVDRAEKMYKLSLEIDEFLRKDKSDYYGILGVQRTATQEEIRQAFNRLVLKFHPDRTKMEESNAVSRIIQKAYLVLSNPEKKKEYDSREAGSSVFNNVRFRYVDASEVPTDLLFQTFASQMYGGFPNVNQGIYENLYRYTPRRNVFRRAHAHQGLPDYRAFMIVLILLLLVFF